MKIKDLVPGIKTLSNLENPEQTAGMIEDHYRMQLGGFISRVQAYDWGISVVSRISVDSMWNHLAVLPGSEHSLLANLEKIENAALENRRFPGVYITAESPAAGELAAALSRENYEPLKVESWMVFQGKQAPVVPRSDSISIKQVETDSELDDFMNIFNDAYATGQVYMGDALKSQFYSQEFPNVRHFIGRSATAADKVHQTIPAGLKKSSQENKFSAHSGTANTPVCIASAILGREGNVCIYNVGTAVAQRRKGYGAVITSYLIKEFMQTGHNTLFLQADHGSGAERIYKRLGFEERFHRIGFIKSSRDIPGHEAESFWRSCLGNIKAPTKLPVEDVPADRSSSSGDVRAVEYSEIPAAAAAGAEDFILRYGLTPDILLTGCCGLLFSRYCNDESALLGLEYPEKKKDKYIFPMPITIDSFPDAGSWLKSIAGLKNRIEEYGDVPLAEIQGWSQVPGEYRLFDILLEFTTGTGSSPLKENRIYPLVCRFFLSKKAFEMNYDRRVYSKDTIQRLSGQLLHLLEEIPKKTGQPPASIEIVTEREKQEILFDFNDTFREYPIDKFIHECFEEQVERTPDRTAIIGPAFWGLKQGGTSSFPQSRRPVHLTYGELDRQAGTLSEILITRGFKPDSIAGIMIHPSIELMIGILAVLKAGGAYLPISPGNPPVRKRYILEDSRAAVLLTAHPLIAEDDESNVSDISMVFLDELSGHLRPGVGTRPAVPETVNDSLRHEVQNLVYRHRGGSGNLSYVIYTSGSTGKPKGVLIEHSAVVNLLFSLFTDYPTTTSDSFLLTTPYVFDVSVVEIFSWFLGGSKLMILGSEERKEPKKIIDKIGTAQITHINFVPSMFNAVLEELGNRDAGKLSSLEYIFLAGEALLPGLVNKYKKTGCTAKLENLYGPTEAAVYASGYSLRDWNGQGSIPIGKPLYNVKLYIFNEENNVQPVGAAGELLISGAGVARGYLNNPELTANKFIASGGQLFEKSWTKTFPEGLPGDNYPKQKFCSNFFKSLAPGRATGGKKLYKTGDLARWLPDGNIQFLGRLDHQVKLRGLRIELGEIENYLLSHEMVREAVVIAWDNEGGDKYLCAYLTAGEKTQRIEPAELREFLLRDLPEYMVPSFFVQLDVLPLNQSGKVDRKRLPEPEKGKGTVYTPPRDKIDARLVGIWSGVLTLNNEKIGIDSGFFTLGGHSLSGAVAVSRIYKEFGVIMTLSQLFEMQTIRKLAAFIKEPSQDIYVPVKKIEEKDYYLLSSAQKRLYILDQVESGSKTYNMPMVFEILREADKRRLEDAFRKLIVRHESFRTSFHMIDGEPVQRIYDPEDVEFHIEYYEEPTPPLRGHLRASPPEGIPHAEIIDSFIRPFDLSKAPLIRACVANLDEGRNLLLIDMHHIVSDGISLDIFHEELLDLYEAKALPALRIQYKDFAAWRNREAKRDKFKRQKDYWLNVFAGEIPILNLVTDYPRPTVQSFEGSNLHFELLGEEATALKKIAQKENVTLFMVLAALVNILLEKLSGQDDIVLGTPAEGRSHPNAADIIGMFVNTLPLRNFPHGNKRFREFLQEIKHNTLNAFENQDYPFENLVESVNVNRDAGRNPIFDVMLILQNIAAPQEETRELKFHPLAYTDTTAKFDLSLFARESEEGISLCLQYCSRLFKQETVKRYIDYFREIVVNAAKNPDIHIAEIEIITGEEKREILDGFNNREETYPTDKTISQLFAEQVVKTPQGAALILQDVTTGKTDRCLTYSQLDSETHRLAGILTGRGIGAGDIAGIIVEPSPAMIVAIIAVLRTGAAYLPLNPHSPEDRNRYMLEDSAAKFCVTTRHLYEEFGTLTGCEIDWVIIDETGPTCVGERLAALRHIRENQSPVPLKGARAACLAYIIYTSGSTGQPKGVPITHGNFCPLLHWGYRHFRLNSRDRVVQNVSYYFDFSVWEIFITLTTGASLIITADELRMNSPVYAPFMVKNGITALHITPSQLQALTGSEAEPVKLETLRLLFIGGERLTHDLLERSYGVVKKDCRLFNMYGPTEAAIISTTLEIDRSGEEKYDRLAGVPIGIPVANAALLVVGKGMQMCPVNVPGELVIAGDGLAPGYLNNPELTHEKFLRSFFQKATPRRATGGKIYKTGDLVRWLPGGNIEFLGRIDQQVKIRGYRIELGEIENRLLQQDDIKEAVVTVRTGAEGNKYLCAYIVGMQLSDELASGCPLFEKSGAKTFHEGQERRGESCVPLSLSAVPGNLDPSELRDVLSRSLPDYMIPSFFVRLEKMPLTPNGKVDRKRLPEPGKDSGIHYLAPRNEIERKLADIWSAALGLAKEKIGIDDNFFELGGHSLKGTVVITAIHKEFNVRMSLGQIFKIPKIRKIADYIKNAARDRYIPVDITEEKEYYELSYAQRRLWILCQFEEESTAYNMPFAFILTGALNTDVFERALRFLISRHDSLRTVFISVKGEPKQRILDKMDFKFEQADLRNMEKEAKGKEGRELFLEGANRVFNLETGPLFLFKLVRFEEDTHLWILNIHHIVNDGWSQGILNNEIFALYNAFLKNEASPLPPLKLKYRDYTLWHNELIKGDHFRKAESYWLEKFKDKPNGIELPLDHSRRPVQTFNGGRVNFSIDETTTIKLHRLCFAEETTLFMGLLSLLGILLYKYAYQQDIIIGLPIAGRKRQELNNIIGFLVNTLVFRNELDPGESFKELVKGIKQETLDCYENQDYPFDILIEKLELERDLSQSPLFNVMLAHNNAETLDTKLVMDGVTLSDYPYFFDFDMSKFDLIFFIVEEKNRLEVMLEYNSDLFERQTIERLSTNLVTLLENILADADAPVSELRCMAGPEYEKVVEEFNDRELAFPPLSIPELFENQVRESGDKQAVVYAGEAVSYRTLNERVNRFAHYLREEYGVKPNDVVGISMERSIDMVVVLLGIVKSGAAYLALDPTYPRERVLHVLGDSRSDILVIDKMRPELFAGYDGAGTGPQPVGHTKRLSKNKKVSQTNKISAQSGTGKILDINEHREKIAQQSPENPQVVNSPADILYVNYTSGSTGTPNGAMLSHDILNNLIHWQKNSSGIDCSLRCLQFTSINFCVSFQEIAGTLTSGGELHLVGDVERQDIDYLMDFLSEHRIEILFLPFSYLNFVFNESSRWGRSFDHSLKHIITAGEQLKITVGLKRFLDLNPHIRLHNHYGSTEMHVVTSYTLDASTAGDTPIPPAGKPVDNVAIYILDEHLQPVPIGVWGELCVKGSSSVPGYINNEELNKKKLIHHPRLSADNRMFRSGDIGRWHEDGNIELRGRMDFQVKIRGFRVEPGEIESRILSIKGVRECVVVVKEDEKKQKYLTAYIVTENITVPDIKRTLNGMLPLYMVPRLVVLKNLPLMPNGKVDRENLPEPEFAAEQEYMAPRNKVEEKLIRIWAGVLSLDEASIGIDANFFDLGGHSLKATVMTGQIQKELQVKVPLTDIFKAPTIAEIAAYITKDAAMATYMPLRPSEEREYYSLSPAQKRLYIVQQTNPQTTTYNMPLAFVLMGAPDPEKITGCFKELLKRHESFRTSFHLLDEHPVQRVHKTGDIKFEIEYYETGSRQEAIGSKEKQGTRPVGDAYMHPTDQERRGEPGVPPSTRPDPGDFIRSFDLTEAPLLRIRLIKEAADRFLLMTDIHHIIFDGVSYNVFFREFKELFNGSDLPALELRYKDFSQWHNSAEQQAERKEHESYWLNEFSGKLPQLNLPIDYNRGESFSYEGDRMSFSIPKEKKDALLEFAKQEEVTLFMLLLAVFYILLAKMCDQEDIIIGIPTAGREHVDLRQIVGMFVNPLPLRNFPEGKKTLRQFLHELKERSLLVYEHQAYQYEDLTARLALNPRTGKTEIFNVMFTLQNLQEKSESYLELDLPGVKSKIFMDIVNKVSRFDITFYAFEEEDRIDCFFEYSTQLFSAETIEIMQERYLLLLDGVIRDAACKIEDLHYKTAVEDELSDTEDVEFDF